jgi:hypothetical protein
VTLLLTTSDAEKTNTLKYTTLFMAMTPTRETMNKRNWWPKENRMKHKRETEVP